MRFGPDIQSTVRENPEFRISTDRALYVIRGQSFDVRTGCRIRALLTFDLVILRLPEQADQIAGRQFRRRGSASFPT